MGHYCGDPACFLAGEHTHDTTTGGGPPLNPTTAPSEPSDEWLSARVETVRNMQAGSWDASVRAALDEANNEVVRLRAELAAAKLEVECWDATLTIIVARLGGKVEGQPTARVNFLQRVAELRQIEKSYLPLRNENASLWEENEQLKTEPAAARPEERAGKKPTLPNPWPGLADTPATSEPSDMKAAWQRFAVEQGAADLYEAFVGGWRARGEKP